MKNEVEDIPMTLVWYVVAALLVVGIVGVIVLTRMKHIRAHSRSPLTLFPGQDRTKVVSRLTLYFSDGESLGVPPIHQASVVQSSQRRH